MTIEEAKDMICKYQLCYEEQLLYDRCNGTIECKDCIYHTDGLDVLSATEKLRDYYIRKDKTWNI